MKPVDLGGGGGISIVGGINHGQQTKSVFLLFDLKYFGYPEETEVRRERSGVYLERRFLIFFWKTKVGYMGKHKVRLVTDI